MRSSPEKALKPALAVAQGAKAGAESSQRSRDVRRCDIADGIPQNQLMDFARLRRAQAEEIA